MASILQVKKRRHAGGGFEDDIAAMSTVTTIRSTVGHEFFPAKATGTVSTVACMHENFCVVDKHGAPSVAWHPEEDNREAKSRESGLTIRIVGYTGGYTLILRRVLPPPSNFTIPEILAKRV